MLDTLNHLEMTRRRVLALGAAGGLSGLLLRVADPVSADAAAAVRTTGLGLPDGAIPGSGRAGVVVRPGRAFDLVGLRGADLHGAAAQVRVRRDGAAWGPWVPLGSGADHAPDRASATPASDPVWAGGAHELQFRARRAVRGGRLALVTSPPIAASVRARGASVRAVGGAPEIIRRSGWGAEKVPPRAAPSFGAVSLAFVHHTVSANDYAPEDSARIVLAIAKYHRDSNGWNDIGYNFLVDKYGQIFEGRAGGIEQAVIGAQAGGWNSQSTGIATLGDFAKTTLPEPAMAALTRLIAWKLSLHSVPTNGSVDLVSAGGTENRFPAGRKVTLPRVSGHRDGCKTECPGATLYGQLDDLRRRVAALGPIAAVTGAVSLVPLAASVRYGDRAVLRGQVRQADGTPAAGATVLLQKTNSTGRWVRVGRARTASDGSYEVSTAWKRQAALRGEVQLGSDKPFHSAAAEVALERTVSVDSPGEKSRVLAGRSVAMRGAVGPSGHVSVTLQRQDSKGRWRSAGKVRASVKGTSWAADVPLRRPALYRLTAVGGTVKEPVRADPVYVRAVRKASSLRGAQGGASAPSTTAGGASAS